MMKLQTVKQEVFTLTCTANTKELRKQRPDLTQGKDLRYKAQWLAILEQLQQLRQQGLDFSLADLEETEGILRDSLAKVGRMAGLSEAEIDLDWQRIKLEAQFADVHIEEL